MALEDAILKLTEAVYSLEATIKEGKSGCKKDCKSNESKKVEEVKVEEVKVEEVKVEEKQVVIPEPDTKDEPFANNEEFVAYIMKVNKSRPEDSQKLLQYLITKGEKINKIPPMYWSEIKTHIESGKVWE